MSIQDNSSYQVSIVIPALHRPDLTQRCLVTATAQTLPSLKLEIVVVEDAHREGPILQVQDLKFLQNISLKQILLEHRLGFGVAANQGMAEAKSKYILLLNNDVEVEPGFLAILGEQLEDDVGLAFVTGKLRQANKRSLLDGAGDALLMAGGVYRLGHGDEDAGLFDQARPVLSGCGGATMYRASALAESGLLDEDFFAYLEDADLALRLHLLGYKGVYAPKAVGYHIGSATFGDATHPRILTLITRNQLLLVIKNYPFSIWLRCLPRIFIFQTLWMALMISKGRFLAWSQGIAGAIKLLPRMLGKRWKLLARSKISSREFLYLLRASEQEIREWHGSRPKERQSRLLRAYFFFCK